MMSPDFSQVYDRAATGAEKYALRNQVFGTEDVLPMWVADQDLPTPPFVMEAIQQRCQQPILGYQQSDESLYQAIVDWQAQYDYAVSAKQIVFTHNVANGFMMAVGAFTRPGVFVMLMPPVYPPFFDAIKRHHCETVEAPLVLEKGRYQIDFSALEAKIKQFHVKLLLFCHPQNPSGRVWQRVELTRLAEICLRHQVLMVSDEIHADLTFAPHRHIPLASLSPEVAQQTITLTSPGKTFNLGGLQLGYALIANDRLKKRYQTYANAQAIYDWNLFAQEAVKAAYSVQGQIWRDALLAHFSDNIQLVETFFAETCPSVKVMRPEASFLIWLDFRARFNDQSALKAWCIEQAKLGLNDGQTFAGESGTGTGFMRMNIAVPQSVLKMALQQLEKALIK